MLHWFLRHTLISRNYLYLLSLLSVSSVLPHPVPPRYVVTEHQAGLPVLFSSFLLIIYFTHGSVNMSLPLTPSLLLPVPSSWRGFSLPTSMRVCLLISLTHSNPDSYIELLLIHQLWLNPFYFFSSSNRLTSKKVPPLLLNSHLERGGEMGVEKVEGQACPHPTQTGCAGSWWAMNEQEPCALGGRGLGSSSSSALTFGILSFECLVMSDSLWPRGL